MVIDSNQFVDECMRISKPCKFEGLARKWPAYEEWRFTGLAARESNRPYDLLEKVIGADTMVDVFIDMDPDAVLESSLQNSFKKEKLTKMKYGEYLNKSGSSSSSLGMTVRVDTPELS